LIISNLNSLVIKKKVNRDSSGPLHIISLILICCAIIESAGISSFQDTDKITVFKDIRVFDGEKILSPCTVILKDSKIIQVGQNISFPKNAEILSGKDLTLLPGLMDAHVHMFSRRDLKQEAVFGITTVFDMMTSQGFMSQTRDWIRDQKIPDMASYFTSGQPATYPNGHGTEWGTEIPTIRTVDDVSAFMEASVTSKADYIKIMSGEGNNVISQEVVAEIARVSKERGLLTLVHIQTYKKALEAIESGVNGLAHCFADSVPDDGFINLMKEKKTFVIPTLSVMNTLPDARRINIIGDKRFSQCLVPEIRECLATTQPFYGDNRLSYHKAELTVRKFHEAGIPILAGTDSYNTGTTHGASLHGELELLTYAGLSPLDALVSATSQIASTFGLHDRGRVAPGMRGDLLLVKGDPTIDITNTRNIVGVWLNGNRLDREPWLAEVEKQNREWERTGEIPAPVNSESGLICDFDQGNYSPNFGFCFFEISDKFYGGSSQSKINMVRGGSDGKQWSLQISGNIDKSSTMPWSGAGYMPSAMEMSKANLSNWDAVSFKVKGDVDSCMVMFLLTDKPMPVGKAERIGSEWKTVTVPFKNLGSLNGKNIMCMVFGRRVTPGAYNIQIDDVRLTHLLTDK
jgi:imidazolonepropionase-like amidohydrolase